MAAAVGMLSVSAISAQRRLKPLMGGRVRFGGNENFSPPCRTPDKMTSKASAERQGTSQQLDNPAAEAKNPRSGEGVLASVHNPMRHLQSPCAASKGPSW